ncbi:MAG TPA: pyridoxal phosphate-dependent aminotransferase [Clostridiales bacterium]|nr:pyridoxal phosphate-dependent aminotransferase [Clostridiales bacterium]
MISKKIHTNLGKSSWIRAMFEEGEKLRQKYGAENVFDFTLGNPDPEPPIAVKKALKDIVSSDIPGIHKYMNNAGFDDVRDSIAKKLKEETRLPISKDNIIMTCGAAGGLNIALKALLDPGDEVIVIAPYFAEYLFYIDNHGGVPIIVNADPTTFQLDLNALEKSITQNTKAIILNSPNNPTGVIYSKEILYELKELIENKEREFKSDIYVLSDEPYSKLVYDNVELPNMLNIFENIIVINSFSKSLALPGERIGYAVVSPMADDVDLLIDGLIFANRILGYVNAPALFQKVIARSLDAQVDVDTYREKRDILYNYFCECGFECIKPQGAFYLFPKTPISDDVAFINSATKYNLLFVPGTGFGYPGYFRVSYCISMDTIVNAKESIKSLAQDYDLL